MYPLTFKSSFLTQQLVSCLLSPSVWQPIRLARLSPLHHSIYSSLSLVTIIYILHTSTLKVSAHYCLGVGVLRPSPLPGSRLTPFPGLFLTLCCVDLLGFHHNTTRYHDFYSSFAHRQSSSSSYKFRDLIRCTRTNTIYSTTANLENPTGRCGGAAQANSHFWGLYT